MNFPKRLVGIICFIELMESYLQLVCLIYQIPVFLVSIYFMILNSDFYLLELSALSEKSSTSNKSRNKTLTLNTITWVYTFKIAKNLSTKPILNQVKQLVHLQHNLSNYQMKSRIKYYLIKSLDFLKKKKKVRGRNILFQ